MRQGTLRDAVLFSVGENAEHGMRRTNADKRRAVTVLLQDEEWRGRSDGWMARAAKVDEDLVARIRAELFPEPALSCGDRKMRLVERGGSVYEMDVDRIGSNQASSSVHREPGHREREHRSHEIRIEQTLLAVRSALQAMPGPHVAAAAVPRFDMGIAERYAIWWTDFAEDLRERQERVS